MFKLKILNTIVEFHADETHPYSQLYEAYIQAVGVEELWQSLVKQYKVLSKEPCNIDGDETTSTSMWIERNMREKMQILHCMIILSIEAPITIKDFSQMFYIFCRNSFERIRCLHAQIDVSAGSLFESLLFSQLALLLSMAKCLW